MKVIALMDMLLDFEVEFKRAWYLLGYTDVGFKQIKITLHHINPLLCLPFTHLHVLMTKKVTVLPPSMANEWSKPS